jgi:peptidoglycan/LPS O-acetylase OafA/YrhL
MGYAGVLSRQLPAQLPYFLFGIWLSSARISQLNYSLLILVSIIFYIVGYRVINHHFIEYPKWLFYPLFIISVASIKSRVNNALGDIDISYGVYLWHFPIAQLFSQWGEYIDVQLYISSVLALTLILAYGSWIFIERPIIRYIRNHIYNATH